MCMYYIAMKNTHLFGWGNNAEKAVQENLGQDGGQRVYHSQSLRIRERAYFLSIAPRALKTSKVF